MEFGYILENFAHNNTPEFLIASASLAEELGFHSIWATDHIMQQLGSRLPIYDSISEAITTLSFLAGHTEKIKLGLSTLVFPIRNTVLVAKQLATLDYLTNGRLITSFGAGWNEAEFKANGFRFSNRGKRLDEQLQVLKTLWNGKKDFSGSYHSFSDVSFEPRLPTLANTPVLVAGNSEYGFQRALKYGTGWHPSSYPASKLKDFLDKHKEKIPKNFEIWVRVGLTGTLVKEELADPLNLYEEIGVTGLLFDLSRNKEGNNLEYIENLAKIIF